MPAFNKVIIMGNLTKDPELKQTKNGISVCSFSIAVQRRFKNADGAYVTDFFAVTAWGQTAEFVSKYFHKGQPILVCGELQNRSYTAQDGTKCMVTEITADEATFTESAKGGQSVSPSIEKDTAPAGNSKFEELAADEDLPF